jgi:hypothetical protein
MLMKDNFSSQKTDELNFNVTDLWLVTGFQHHRVYSTLSHAARLEEVENFCYTYVMIKFIINVTTAIPSHTLAVNCNFLW